jgi:hypothetical protein
MHESLVDRLFEPTPLESLTEAEKQLRAGLTKFGLIEVI